jgi:cytochrome c biogenesis protein CcmG/thiol:disulfide interchange protein DsbE
VNRTVTIAGLAVCVPLLVLLVLGLGRDPKSIDSPLVGRPAPPFSLKPAGGGNPVSAAALAGRPAVINFWATWCAPCYEEHPVLVAAARTYGERVRFLGVVYEDEESRVLEFLKQADSAYPSLMDPEGRAAVAYGVFGVPETFFLDAQGQIVAKESLPLSAERMAELIARAEGSRP